MYEKVEMSEKQDVISGNKAGQIRLLVLSGILFFVFLVFLILLFSIPILTLFILQIIFSLCIHWAYGKCFDVWITNEAIVFENIWKKRQYERKNLKEIRLAATIFPYPFNPFLTFRFNNRVKVYSKIDNPRYTYLSKGGIGLYIADLEEKITGNVL